MRAYKSHVFLVLQGAEIAGDIICPSPPPGRVIFRPSPARVLIADVYFSSTAQVADQVLRTTQFFCLYISYQ